MITTEKLKKETPLDLIDSLVAENEPVKVVTNSKKQLFIWVLLSLFCISVGLFIVGLRQDFSEVVMTPSFIGESIFSLFVAVIAAGSAFTLSIPGKEEKYSLSTWTFLPLVGWFGIIIYQWITETPNFMQGLKGFHCTADIIALGIIPAFVLFVMIKKGAPLKLGKSGLMTFVAAFAIASFTIRFSCGFNNPVHLLASHFLPIFGIGLLGYWVGKLFLRW